MKVRTIDLKGRISLPNDAGIEFLRAEMALAHLNVSFAIVRCALHGVEQEYGLRLDLDKRVFLDHFEDDEKLEEAAQNALPKIIEVGGEALYPRQAPPEPVTYFSRISEPV